MTSSGPERHARRDPLLLAAGLVAILGVIVVAAWSAAWGIALLFAAAGLYLLRGEIERRTGRSGVEGLHAHAETMRRTVAVRSKGQMGLFRARRELADLEAERGALLRELGEATYGRDEGRADGVRARIDELVDRIRVKQDEIEGLARDTEEHVTRIRSEGRSDPGNPPGSE